MVVEGDREAALPVFNVVTNGIALQLSIASARTCEGRGPFGVMLGVMDETQRAEVVDAWWRGDLSDEDRDELLALQRGDPVPDRFVNQLAALHIGGFSDWAFEGQPHMGFQNPAWFSALLDLKRRARG
jgi:hypothetical protein